MTVTEFPGERREAREPRIRLIPFNQIKLQTTNRHLIKGLVPANGLIVVWGPPKCGKSFWVTDAMLHNALGWTYRGRRVRRGPIVYCAMEGASGYGARIEAFRQRHLAEVETDIPFFLVPSPMTLVRDRAALIAAIKLELLEAKPIAIVLDTLNRSIEGSESSDEDMGSYVKAADALWSEFNCAVIIVHHCGVDEKRPRGHTSLTGAADAQLSVKRDTSGNIVVTVEWMKDGPEGDTIVSCLEKVEVGIDEDGDAITSCVVVPVEGPIEKQSATRKLSDRQRLALDALAECAINLGKAPPIEFGLPSGLHAVTTTEWRDELFARDILDREAGNPREDFRRLRQSLAARHLIGERNGFVWRAS